jgi:hypothetical protein
MHTDSQSWNGPEGFFLPVPASKYVFELSNISPKCQKDTTAIDI